AAARRRPGRRAGSPGSFIASRWRPRRATPLERRRARMRLGMIGLGKMGGNMTERLLRDGHEVVVFDVDEARTREYGAREGASAAPSLAGVLEMLEAPRVIWVMVPAGEPTELTLRTLAARAD